MTHRLVLIFFGFFLTSRFFSEVLGVLPKWTDVIDMPFILGLAGFSIFFDRNCEINPKEDRLVLAGIFVIVLLMVASALLNSAALFPPAVLLFGLGFLSGPLLFVSLTRLVNDAFDLAVNIQRLLKILLAVNLLVVAIFNLPKFIESGNPDVIAGTYGINQNLFSVLLLICGSALLGDDVLRNRNKLRTILGQTLILGTFYLLQFRAAVLFFLIAYAVLLISAHGRRIIRMILIVFPVLLIVGIGISFVLARTQNITSMKYEDWQLILSDPSAYVEYGKFQAYPATASMMIDNPLCLFVGVGPGNYLSRAYYTFSFEMAGNKSKGVGDLVEKLFGLDGPRFTEVSESYLGPIRTGAVLGSYQLSNPNSSFLAPVAEIGIIGGGIIIAMYLYMVIRSFKLLRQAKEHAREFLPMATALVAGSVYLFCLASLDNYWEQSRATLPVWLLFWGTSAGVYSRMNAQQPIEGLVD